MDNAKSDVSNAPLPPVVLYTASLNVTAIVLLSEARDTEEIVGAVSSAKATVLLDWVVDAA
ncbi:MAG TPA: hypothetical protein QGH36_06700, partial [Candidatus Marinimicrobia bacterium]|nr:hypothetical protein [Candidatus Neomarinimicrobiota bacterium]